MKHFAMELMRCPIYGNCMELHGTFCLQNFLKPGSVPRTLTVREGGVQWELWDFDFECIKHYDWRNVHVETILHG